MRKVTTVVVRGKGIVWHRGNSGWQVGAWGVHHLVASDIIVPAGDEQAKDELCSAAPAAEVLVHADHLLRLSSELGGLTSKDAISQRLVKALHEFWDWDACF